MRQNRVRRAAVTVAFALIALCGAAAQAQTTYTWNQTGTASFATATNWTPTRTAPAANDVLVFSNGATTIATGVTTQSIGQLSVSGSTTVALQPATGLQTLTLGGGAGALSVASGSALNISGGTTTTTTLTLALASGSTGSVNGSMTLSGAAHKVTAANASGLTFQSGSVCTTDTGFSGNAFGGSGTANSVVFASGSKYVHKAGSNPFALTAPASIVVFQSGSLFSQESTSGAAFSGRTYADYEWKTTTASATGGSAFVFDNLTVTTGTLNLNLTNTLPGSSIKGNISVASGAILTFSPTAASTLNLNGTIAQTITNAGTLSFGSNLTLNVSNANGIVLGSNVTVAALALNLTNGTITTGANTLAIGANVTMGRTSGYVIGNLKKTYATSGSRVFEVGTANGYSPVIANVTSGTGDLTVSATQSVHPNVGASTSLLRYWTLTATGLTADLTFQYLPTDVQGNESIYKVASIIGGVATTYPSSTVDATLHTGSITGISNLSADWTATEGGPVDPAPSITASTVPANGTYKLGDILTFTITWDENVTVTGSPLLALTLDSGVVNANYASGTGTSTLTFTYTVGSTALDTNGIVTPGSITLNGGTIKDSGTNNAATSVTFASTAGVLVDGVAPTVSSIARVGASPTNATSLDYTVTFSEAVTGVDIADFSLTAVGTASGSINSVTPVSAIVYTVNVASVTGDGTLRLDLKASGTGIADLAGNAITTGFSSGQTYTLDHAAPVVSSVAVPANSTYTIGQNLDFTVNFTEAVTVSAPRIPLTLDSGAVNAAYLSGTGTSALVFRYTVQSGDFDTDGITVGSAIDLNGGTIQDSVGNNATLTLNNVGSTTGVLVDANAPSVVSVNRVSATPTNAASVDFTVTFSQSVTGVDATDFAVTMTGSVTLASVTTVNGSGTTYTVTVNTGTGDGTIRLDVVNNGSIVGSANSVPLSGAFSSGQIYTIDKTAPTVLSSNRVTATPTNAASVQFTVTFSEPVTGVDTSNFALATTGVTGASVTGVTGSGTTYTVTVNTGSGDGTIRLDVVSNGMAMDAANNIFTAGFTTGQAYAIDKSAPSVSSVVRASTDPTSASSVNYTVTFSESVTGVDAGDFALTTTGVTGASVGTVTGSGTTYTVAVNTGSGSGTIRLDVNANGTIVDAAGNALSAAFTTGEVYTVNKPPAAPTGLVATAGNATVGLTWTASSGATGYNVKRSTTSGSGYVTIAPNVATTSYTDNAVTNGTTYYYVVSALNANGESADSAQASATPTVPASSLGVVISQLYGGNGNAYANDYVELFNRTAGDIAIGGYSLQYGSATGQFGSVATNIYTIPSGTVLAAGKYLTVKFGAAGAGLPVPFDLDGGTSSLNMSGTTGKVAFATVSTALGCGATATPCALPHPNIIDVVAYGTANNGEGGTTAGNGAAISASAGPLRKFDGCQDTNNNNNDFLVATTATGLTPRTAATPANICGPMNVPPFITAPANPAATVPENSAPFTVTINGTDDGGVYSWSATPGAGVANVIVTAGQGTSSVTYQVTLQTNFYGTATFTAALTDNVNTPATQTVNIGVNRDVTINHAPTITAPADPIVTVGQNSAPVNVNLTGNDDNAVYTWTATPGTGVTSVIVTAGQGTATVTYNVTIQAGFIGMAAFTAQLSDGVNPATTQTVHVGVSPTGSTVSHLVISQLYGGGGNTGATFTNDYVEIYNPTGTPVNLSGWTLQYSSATNTGNFSGVAPLSGIIGPAEYFLIGLQGGAVGAPLPSVNLTGDINMSATAGKVALVRNGDALTGSCGTLLSDPDIVDFVGYGTTANCSEGGAVAPAPSNTTALFRKNNGDTDTDNNGNDFITGTPAPRRTSPIQEVGPAVASTDPSNGDTIAPRDANLVITFTEPVDVLSASWYDITCTVTGNHNSATYAQSGTRNYTIVPNVNFQAGEQCTATLFASAIRDTDTDDANPGTDFLASNYSWTFTIASGTAPPYSSIVHLTMCNPSGAVADVNVPNNYLMEKPEMAISYNRDKGVPNWVSWHLTDEWVGSLVRNDTFRADPAVLPTWYRVLGSDFQNSGFDRGHLTPNADRDKETSVPINQATFLMTNMIPQAPDNNQGPWANMENDLRLIVGGGNELYIVAGGAGSGGTGSNGFATTIANGHVAVPASTWKVVMVLPKASGDDVARVTAATQTIAVIMPNTQGIRTDDWHSYITTVDAVEALTGYDFFCNVPDPIENAIEGGTNGTNPPGAANQSVSTNEDAAASFTLNAVSPSGGSLTYTILTQPVNGVLSGTGANRTYTPAPNYNGSDSFTYRVNDGSRDSNIATVTLTVLEVNDVPVANGDAKTAAGNATLSFPSSDLTANDTAGPANESTQTLTVTAVSATATTHGSVSVSAGTVTYTPTTGYTGPADFSYTVCDNGVTAGLTASLCSSALVNVTVTTPVVPVVTRLVLLAPSTVTAGVPFTVTVQALDANNNAVPAYTGTVHFTSSGPAALPGDYTFSAADQGTHVFSVTFSTNGSQTITVTDGTFSATATSSTVCQPPFSGQAPIAVATAVCGNSTGNSASVSVPGATSYVWQIMNGTITSGQRASSITFTAGPSGAVGLTATAFNESGCEMQSGVVTVAIAQPAAILDQTGDVRIRGGERATLKVTVTPGSVVRWFRGTVGDESTPLFTGPVYTTDELRSTTLYWATVSSVCGTSVRSEQMSVTVVAAKRRAVGH